jgi:hypothetical protein
MRDFEDTGALCMDFQVTVLWHFEWPLWKTLHLSSDELWYEQM